ncbi:MAG: ferrous iron transport protein A [Methanosarcinaceae archaeon]|nr:ferrous iron transport protein A [Methanosarcinaceae archaeon]
MKRRKSKRCGKCNIYNAENETAFVVEEVPDLAMLPGLGIYPGSIVYKEYCCRLGGPVVLKLQNRRVAIGKDVASSIMVEENSNEHD